MHKVLWLNLMMLRAPEGGGGSGAGDGGAPNGAPGAAPGGGDASAAAGAGAAAGAAAPGAAGAQPGSDTTPPGLWADFLPDNLRGADDRETFGRLAADWKARRDADAKRPQPPASAAEYTIEPDEALKPYLSDPNDPVLALAREAALDIKLPKESFQKFVTQIYSKAAEAGLLNTPYNPQAEIRSIAERLAPGRPYAEQKPVVERALADATSFAGVLADQLKLSEGAKGLLSSLADEAAGVELLSSLSGAMAPLPSFARGGTAGQGWTAESLNVAVADERYNPMSRTFDKDFRARVDAGFRQVYGGG